MPPTYLGRFTTPAATRRPAELKIPFRPGEERCWVQDDDPGEGPPATNPQSSRLARSAAVRPRENFRPHPFDDPCNYLG